ncbi:secreted phosphoprotein 24 [Cololabis saira]|uniref:secreted phosphoprotein 24 n=1 Tax=Cololabis saira TaxID=129043 RepID=UPI002AD5ABD6|nr:secreted phosphoprotein 24 [Cololabis saira]
MKDKDLFRLELNKMKTHMLLLVLLQCLVCTGIPLYSPELKSMANRGLGAALTEVNSAYAVSHLFRVTQASIKKVIPRGLGIADLLMGFGIKETECAQTSRNDPQTCAFRLGFFVPTFSCSARVQVSATLTQVMSLRCGHGGSSSSSESSEEMFSRGRLPFAHRAPPPPPPRLPPIYSGSTVQSQTMEPRPREETFSNFLE